ncbi:MAG: HepT-like ribonuclease domain-containing protein [Chloroflexota bacterium]
MVVKRESITERLKELDRILNELHRHDNLTLVDLQQDMSQRWIIERGLIAGAALILDIADHILTSEFGLYAHSYEESLQFLHDKQVISDELYSQIRGLGGFRNVLVHLYHDIDVQQVWVGWEKARTTFPLFIAEVLAWLEK